MADDVKHYLFMHFNSTLGEIIELENTDKRY